MATEKKYVCTLDEKSLKKAKEELNEDANERDGAISHFRQWIQSNPKIKCPTDDDFLLFFLRARYFSQLESRNLLERYLASVTKGGAWFHDLDTAHQDTIKVLEDGLILLLPGRDDEGRVVYILRPGKANLSNKYTNDELFRTFACFVNIIFLTDEWACVNGTAEVLDFQSYTMKHHTSISLAERKNFMNVWQGNFPARIKVMHFVNIGPMGEIIMQLAKLVLSDKLQQRMKVHGQVMEGLYKDIPMRMLPKEYLPDDYIGPNAGSEQELIDSLVKKFKSEDVRQRIKYLSSSKFGIFEDASKENKFGKIQEDKTAPVQASFRKLNVD